MAERDLSRDDILQGADLYPRTESARVATQGAWIGFVTSVALIGMFIVLVATQFNPIALAWLVLLAVALTLAVAWSRIARPRRNAPTHFLLASRVKADLLTELHATDVHVESDRDVVTLRGTVPYADFREAAVQIARRAGAHRVNNAIEVVSGAPKPADDYLKGFSGVTTPEGAPEATPLVSLEENVYEALAADTRVNVHLIEIREDLGMVTLLGRQGTVEASQAAMEIAAHQPGVLGVVNEIEVMPGL